MFTHMRCSVGLREATYRFDVLSTQVEQVFALNSPLLRSIRRIKVCGLPQSVCIPPLASATFCLRFYAFLAKHRHS